MGALHTGGNGPGERPGEKGLESSPEWRVGLAQHQVKRESRLQALHSAGGDEKSSDCLDF